MADFGLAAQIGRGNAMPGAQQQQDPQNRMMQMMQLQQLQQNMMLAREQEGRAARLAPLTETNLQEGINTERARQRLLDPQTLKAGAEASVAQDALSAQRGVLKYISETPKELIADPKNLDVLRRTNAGAYTTITQMIAEKDALEAKARTEKYTAGQKLLEQQAMARRNMFSLLPAVTDQKSFDVLYPEYEGIDPVGAKLIGRKFDPKNMAALSSRLMALDESEIKVDAFGNRYREFKRTGQTEALSPMQPAAQAAMQPAAQGAGASPFGSTALTAPGLGPDADAATFNAARAAGAGVAPYTPPGETPIIGQRVPPAAQGFGPKAEAVRAETLAREQAQASVKEETQTKEQQKGRTDVAKTIANMTSLYDRLNELKGIPDERGDFGANAVAYLGSTAAGQTAEKMLATRAQTQRNAITSAVRVLISDMKKATGMSAQELNNIKELELMLEAASNPSQSIQSVQQILSNLNERYGDGKPVTFKSLSAAPDNTPPRRGAAAPAAAAPAAAPAGGMTPQERTEAMNWLRANPNDPRAATIKQRLGVQ